MMKAWDLHQVLPDSVLKIIPDAGHTSSELDIVKEFVSIIDNIFPEPKKNFGST